jgi:DNA-binding NarL/FixJ family response regulator
MMKISVALIDNHQLFLRSLSLLIESFDNIAVVACASNCETLVSELGSLRELPDILLIDVDMPTHDGYYTARLVTQLYPQIKQIALSVRDDDIAIIQMLKAGCCSYLVKDVHPDTLEKALNEVFAKGYFNSDFANINYRRLILQVKEESIRFSPKEIRFLQLASSDLTYKQIAIEMNQAERTIDGYRESLFEKFNVQSRTGMVLEGIRKKLILLDEKK